MCYTYLGRSITITYHLKRKQTKLLQWFSIRLFSLQKDIRHLSLKQLNYYENL